MIEKLQIIRTFSPFILLFLSWYIWSIKQHFVNKEQFQKELSKIKDDFYQSSKKQDESIVEIKANYKHICSSIDEIKDMLKRQ